MSPCVRMAVVAAALLASGCFQKETPRRDPRTAEARIVRPAQAAPAAVEADEESPPSMEGLIASLHQEADAGRRREAIYAIADAAGPDGAAIIGQALTDPDPLVRHAAVEALTGLSDPTAADWLSIGLGDPDPRVRRSAVEALGAIGGDSARFLLPQALQDVDPGVREAAAQMLEEAGLAAPGIS